MLPRLNCHGFAGRFAFCGMLMPLRAELMLTSLTETRAVVIIPRCKLGQCNVKQGGIPLPVGFLRLVIHGRNQGEGSEH